MTIKFFSKSETFSELSNFAAYPIEIDGAPWPSVEHYYQAQKFEDAAIQEKIRTAKKPVIAKKLAQKHRNKIRADWAEVRDVVMERAVRAKFEQHAALKELLRSTGDEELAEAAPSDYYWGIGADGSGQNKLGRLLMQIRSALHEAQRRHVEVGTP